MNNTTYLFSNNWINIFITLLIIAITFLDKIIPPFGVPIAVICIILLFIVRKVHFKYLGLFKPESWIKTISIGVIIGILIQVLGIYILTPLNEWLGIIRETPDAYQNIEGNNSQLMLYLVIAWTTAGFGEELIYRAFFLGQFSSVFKSRRYKWIISLTISSIIFGLWHYNNGIDAVISTGITGFIIGLVYLNTNRNIWTVYIAHAVTNTIGFLIIYTGLYKELL